MAFKTAFAEKSVAKAMKTVIDFAKIAPDPCRLPFFY
jgi:hypothetical protein